jgi:Cdc6-like AAA superfamily ATPase
MLEALRRLDEQFAFQTSGRFDLLAGDHVPYRVLGARDVDETLRRAIERGEGVISVVGRMGSGKSSLIAAVTNALDEGFVPLRVSVIGVEAGDPPAFARHAITEIQDLPEIALARHEAQALQRAAAERTSTSHTRELRAGFRIAAGHVLSAGVIGDIKQAATDELSHKVDSSETMRGIQRLFDVFWKIDRCPLLIVEDTDHWGGAPEIADAFFDQTARAFATFDAVMLVAVQSDYTRLNGYARIRDRLTAEVTLPRLPDPQMGLRTILERRIAAACVDVSLDDVLDAEGLDLLSTSYLESVSNSQAGDLRRTLAVMRTALDVALADETVQTIGGGHVQEAIARTPLAPPSGLARS